MAQILKGAEVTAAMKIRMQEQVEALGKKGIKPMLGIVRIGARADDLAYERGAKKRCEDIGVSCKVFEFAENITHVEFVQEFKKINENSDVHGILVFRPMPKHINEDDIKNIINPQKDVDCFNPVNAAKVFAGDESGFAPCTPEAVIELLDHYKIQLSGRNAVVIGRSMVVGKPLSMLLLKKNATVTVCHTRTRNIEEVCRGAEILIAAAGKARMVTGAFVPPGCTVIDVGINVDEAGKLCGDVDYESVHEFAGSITPVPGGVGTVTASVLVKHVIQAAERLQGI